MKFSGTILSISLLLTGCLSNGAPKKIYEGPDRPTTEVAIVHPIAVPGGLMMITAVDNKSTFVASVGFFGSVYVLPGERTFTVEVSHGFKIQDAGGPAWTAPPGVAFSALNGSADSSLLVRKGNAVVSGRVEAGKVYEIRFGFNRTNPAKPIPVVWLSAVSAGE